MVLFALSYFLTAISGVVFWRGRPKVLLMAFLTLSAAPAEAQIAADGTVGTQVNASSSVPCVAGSCTITGGTRVGENLFHSFSEFSVFTGGSAVFDSGTARTIFSRVTGGNPSLIDGVISVPGSTNLFLLNPSGLVFGSNATLAIGGSFVGSTADRVLFDNGAQFSAQNPGLDANLLTVTAPVGLQTGTNPGGVVVQGLGNNLFFDFNTFEVIRDFRPPGLAVLPGQTLALIGGDITLDGGNLTAPGGHVEIGSLGPTSTVGLIPLPVGYEFDYGSVSRFSDIQLLQAASVDGSGDGGGSINLQGLNVSLRDGSTLLNDTLGAIGGGNITVQSNSLEVSGVSPLAPFVSSIFADAGSAATRPGGSVSITVETLRVFDGGQIAANTFGDANGGQINIQAGSIALSGGSPIGPSGIFAIVAVPSALGNGGNITIGAGELSITEGAQVSVLSEGVGTTGDLTITAETISLSGFLDTPAGLFPSLIVADLGPNVAAPGGSMVLEADRLQVTGGAQISSGTFGAANAGAIQIRADDIQLVGTSQLPSGIFAPVAFGAGGNGGMIKIQANQLQALDGAQIATSTLGFGNAGDIQIDTSGPVRLVGQSAAAEPSGIFASSAGFPGAGGNVTINSARLEIIDGAEISARNTAALPGIPAFSTQGGAGNLSIVAPLVLLDNRAVLNAETEAGDRGNINVVTDLLLLRRGSNITTNAGGTSSGGNIFIDARNGFIVARSAEDSNIMANAIVGSGGRVDIFTQGLIGIEPRPSSTELSDITASSEFGVSGTVTINTFNADPILEESDLPDTPGQPRLLEGCETTSARGYSQFIQAGRDGLRPFPFDALSSNQPLGDVQPPQGWLGDEALSRPVESSQLPTPAVVEAQGWRVNAAGNLMLVADGRTSASRSGCQYQAPDFSLPVRE